MTAQNCRASVMYEIRPNAPKDPKYQELSTMKSSAQDACIMVMLNQCPEIDFLESVSNLADMSLFPKKKTLVSTPN